MADKHLDARNMQCPVPILMAKKAIKELKSGQTLEVQATDPGSKPDFAALCEATGHELVSSTENAGIFQFLIRIR